MNLEKRIEAFAQLGHFLNVCSDENQNIKNTEPDFIKKNHEAFRKLIQEAHNYNGWFTEENVRSAISSISKSLTKEEINKWIEKYKENLVQSISPKTIVVIMAGNIPVVGFHDFLCVLISGNKFLGKLSSQDKYLLPAIADVLIEIEPGFSQLIEFTEERIKKIDAIIATGSNNTSRYFEYYFGKYPNIIRKNRNSLAILNGDETEEELKNIAKDIFQYFGLGCRNVSKLFVPEKYSFEQFFNAVNYFQEVKNHHKYFNNYEYNKAIYLINNERHFDNGFLILKESQSLYSPVGVIYFEYYSKINEVIEKLETDKNNIQCIISKNKKITKSIPFGLSQLLHLWDYADDVDTIEFLLKLSN